MASSDVKRSTFDGRGGKGGRRGSTAPTKTKRSKVTKALIVCDRWGPSIHGGVTDGLHLAIRLLQNMGISVHCTALQATEEEELEAEELGVNLELPTKTGTLQFRSPTRDWLLYHNVHYPKLEELANVKFVFGFSAFTSEAAFHITSKVFPKASCYLINLFDKDDITPLIVGCSKEEVEFRKRIMSDEFKNAKCSFSVGERVFARYRRLYHETNQKLLSPIVNEEYLLPPRSDKLPILEHERFQILSVVQEYEFDDLKKLDVVINAVNAVADDIYELQKTPPAWKIIGIPPSREDEVVDKLTRSSRLKITPTYVTRSDELNNELLSSHLVLIPPTTTSYVNLTLAGMCAAIPVVYPRGSHSHELVNTHIDVIEAKECAIDMDEDPKDLKKRIISVMLRNATALERAKIIRDHIKDKVVEDLRNSNENFFSAITADMQATFNDKNDPDKDTESDKSKVSEQPTIPKADRGTHKQENISSLSVDQSQVSHTSDVVSNISSEVISQETIGEPDVRRSKRKSKDSPSHQLWQKKNKRKRGPCQIEVKVRPDGIIPKEGKRVREVTGDFYSNEKTKENAILVGKQLNQRHKRMKLHHIGKSSISYIMDCQSLEALESLMGDYSSGSLHRMVKSTFLSESLLDEIGALYLSLETSIDYEEYLLCQEELADTEDEEIYHLSIEQIEEMNEKFESEIKGHVANVSVKQVATRDKARDRDILRGMSVEEDKARAFELDKLMNEWIQIKEQLQQLNITHSDLVFDHREFTQNVGAIVNEVDIPLEMKQELMAAFQKFLPVGTDKTGKPGQKLVIEGDLLMEYVENTILDFNIPTETKGDMKEQFRMMIKKKSGKSSVTESLAAKQENLHERIQAIIDDADIPGEQKEVYHKLRHVERGKPLPDTIRSLSRPGKKPGEVLNPRGLTINQNRHILVSDYRYGDSDDEDSEQPGSVKTVTADTAQILTSVTVHGLPHRFSPYDTKMADNGDYYTADIGNKCIVVSDAKSKVKQIIAMGKLKEPTGVFVDKDRNVFIADYKADCVIKCNGDGDIISSQQLSKPWSLTMNSKYQLIVSCHGDVKCIVYILDSNLEILNQFGSDHLVYPYGVTVDNADNIYVADDRKIVKFDRQGEYQETVTEDVDPWDIAVFTDGRIVCSDANDDTVKVIYK